MKLLKTFERLFDQPYLAERLEQIQLNRSQLEAIDFDKHIALSYLLAGPC